MKLPRILRKMPRPEPEDRISDTALYPGKGISQRSAESFSPDSDMYMLYVRDDDIFEYRPKALDPTTLMGICWEPVFLLI
jgi:hypothetical protein